MVDINTHSVGSLTISSVEELLKVGNSFGNQLASLSSSLWTWRLAAVTSLAVGTLSAIGAMNVVDEDERGVLVLLTGLSGLAFVYSMIQWSSISGQISNVSFLHQRALAILNATV